MGSLYSYISDSEWHTLAFTLSFSVNAEWANPRNDVLARICLPEIIALYLGSLHSYIYDSKWHTLSLAFSFFVNAKQANQRNFILARICLVEIIWVAF